MDNIFCYLTKLPDGINEAVMVCADGYTVYISDKLNHDEMLAAYQHALGHIKRDDLHCELYSGVIERRAHES